MAYRYPDPNDTITCRTIPRYEEDREGYWALSEEKILERIKAALSENGTGGEMLDIGCGEGRLLPVFAGLFQRITAIEPDPDRFRRAEETIQTIPCFLKIKASNELLEDFKGDEYDFILCSHIIQHIPTATFLPFIEKIARLARKGAVVALTTTHSTRPDDVYVKSEIDGPHTVETEITAEEFDSYTDGRTNILPIRFFNARKLIPLFDALGLSCIDYRVFHVESDCFSEKPADLFIDDYANAEDVRKESCGRDMLLLFRKTL